MDSLKTKFYKDVCSEVKRLVVSHKEGLLKATQTEAYGEIIIEAWSAPIQWWTQVTKPKNGVLFEKALFVQYSDTHFLQATCMEVVCFLFGTYVNRSYESESVILFTNCFVTSFCKLA